MSKKPMFDIEDSPDVILEDNRTNRDQIARVARSPRFKGRRNNAGETTGSTPKMSWPHRILRGVADNALKIVIGIVVTAAGAIAKKWLGL